MHERWSKLSTHLTACGGVDDFRHREVLRQGTGERAIDAVRVVLRRPARLEIAVSYKELLEPTDGSNALRPVVLDDCRNNPFNERMRRDGATRGFAPPPEMELGTQA